MVVVAVGGYSLVWFVVCKRSFEALIMVFKEKNFKELLTVFEQLKGEIPEDTDNGSNEE